MFNSSNGNGFSLADIAAVLKGNGDSDGLLGGNGITAIILLIIIMAFFGGWNNNGGGFSFGGGNGGGSAVPYVINASTNTDNEVARGFSDLTINNKLDQISSDICQGINGVNISNLQGFGALNTQLCSAFDGVTAGITNLGYNLQNDLLQLTNAIDGVKYENAAQTAQIIQAGSANTQRLMDLINQNTMQDLRDQLTSAKGELSQSQQTNDIISTLLPVARPAYLTASPYASQSYYNGCPCMQS